ncbi:polysaccharide biosynthesis protein [Halobacillus faecis]
MSRQKRLLYFGVLDSLIIFTSIYISVWIMFPSSSLFTGRLFILSASLVIGHVFFAHYYKIYKRAWEYASVEEVILLVKSITFSILAAGTFQFILSNELYYRVLTSTWMIQIILIIGSRYSLRLIRERTKFNQSVVKGKRTLIIGAGKAGSLVVSQIKRKEGCELNPVAFLDDDIRKHDLHILSVPVVGGLDHLQEKVLDLEIERIIIAIPSLSKKKLDSIYRECKKTRVEVQMVPMFEDLVTGKLEINDMKKVNINHLLGREPVDLDTLSMKRFIKGNTILVTGAGGSIGSEICRQISQFNPAKIVLLGHGENSIYSIHRELQESFGDHVHYVTEIADIKDRHRMMAVMGEHQPQIVIHAAAHKHVPLMENYPFEAVANNVFGTRNVAEAADTMGVDTFIMISSDKAVNPTSVMGSTKRIAEMIVQDLNKKSPTRFVAVRFGNVLGSRGSVLPLFMDQIKRGGPLTVTDENMTRYFMTIPEASRLVLQAGALAEGGEIFVLDMGEPVKIIDLAKNLIHLSGFTEKEIGIKVTGIRPGEKLYEELLCDKEIQERKVHPRIYIGKTMEFEIEKVLLEVEDLSMRDKEYVREVLLSIANPTRSAFAAAR